MSEKLVEADFSFVKHLMTVAASGNANVSSPESGAFRLEVTQLGDTCGKKRC